MVSVGFVVATKGLPLIIISVEGLGFPCQRFADQLAVSGTMIMLTLDTFMELVWEEVFIGGDGRLQSTFFNLSLLGILRNVSASRH